MDGILQARRFGLVLCALVPLTAALLAGCAAPAVPRHARHREGSGGRELLGNIAAQVGGAHVQVTSILSSPAADPHLYESDVASAVAVAEARLVIANGAGYDDFLSQFLLGATRNAGRVVVSAQVALGAYGPDVNPHFWYDIPRVPRVAAAIEAALARLEPADAQVFAANLKAFDASLRAPERDHRGRPPPVPGHAGRLHRAGSRRVAAGGRARGGDPARVRRRRREWQRPERRRAPPRCSWTGCSPDARRRCLCITPRPPARSPRGCGRWPGRPGFPVVPVTETMPPSFRSYQAWQLAQAAALLSALGGRA